MVSSDERRQDPCTGSTVGNNRWCDVIVVDVVWRVLQLKWWWWSKRPTANCTTWPNVTQLMVQMVVVMFLLPVLGDGVVNQCLLRFSVGVLLLLVVVRSGGDGCEIEENALPFACFFVVVYYDFVWFMMVLSLSSSSSFVLLPMRNEDAWYSVRVLSWKLGTENPFPVTVRTTVVHSFICDSPRLKGLHPVFKAVVLDRSA